jgi:hypothetical protein
MNKINCILCFLLLNLALNAQQIATSSGNTVKNEFSAEWIIGGSLIDNSVFFAVEDNALIIKELSEIAILDVFPSITRDYLKIVMIDSEITQLEYKIVDMNGVNTLKGIHSVDMPHEIDVKGLAAGIYTIVFNQPGSKIHFNPVKFIKL